MGSLACSPTPPHQNPFDPNSPPGAQAKATLAGTISLESAGAAGAAVAMAGTHVAVGGTGLSADTDANGAYSIARVDPGTYGLQVSRAGYDPQTISGVTVTLNDGDKTVLVPEVKLLVSRGSVGGTLAVEGRTDASGILLTLSGGPAGETYTAVTGSAGVVSLQRVRAGNVPYVLTAALAGYQSYTSPPIAVAAGQQVSYDSAKATLAVLRSAQITGSLSLEGRTNAAGAVAHLSGADLNSQAVTANDVTLTAASSSYAFAGLPQGTYSITLLAAGFSTRTLGPVSVSAGASAAQPLVQLALARGAVTVTVALPAAVPTQPPKSGTVVQLSQAGPSAPSFIAVTDSSGVASFAGVPVGNYSVATSRAGYQGFSSGSTTFAVAEGATTAVPAITLAYDTSAGITGTCQAMGAPAQQSSTVSVTGADFNGNPVAVGSVQTATDTTFAVSGLRAGSYALSCSRPGFDPKTVGPFSLGAGQTYAGVSFALQRSIGAVYGTIALGANGTSLPLSASDNAGVGVTVSDASLPASFGAITDPSGNYSISGIPAPLSGGPYTITAAKPGFWSSTATALVVPGTASLISGITINVALTNLSGGVLLEDPQPPPSNSGVVATLTGVAFNGASYSRTSGSVNAPGNWSIAAVPAGNYTISLAGSSTYLPAQIASVVVAPLAPSPATPGAVTAPSRTLLRGLATYSGTVQPSANGTGLLLGSASCTTTPAADCANIAVHVSDAALSATFGAITDSSGRFTIPGVPLPPDPAHGYTVVATKSGYLDAAETGSTVLAAGGTSLAPITLSARGSQVRGCVFVPAPAPDSIAGVSAVLSGVAFNGTAYSATGSVAADSTCAGLLSGAAGYSFAAVPDGSYTVTLARNAYLAGSVPPTATVAGAAATATPLLTRFVRASGTVSGTISFNNPVNYSPGVVLDLSKARAGAVVTIDGAELTGGHLVATTDSSGQFTVSSVPANVSGVYTVTASASHFTANTPGSDSTTVTVNAGAIATASGLSLKVNAGTIQATALLHDFGCASRFVAAINGCNVSECVGLGGTPGTDQPAVGVGVSMSGTAFTGDAVTPNAQTTNASGQVTVIVPPGSYTISAAPAGRTSDSRFVTVSDGQAPPSGCVALVHQDLLPPTTPSVAAARASPTSASSTNVSVVQSSTDPTLPGSNFRGYRIRVCSPVCNDAISPVPYTGWTGSGPIAIPLTDRSDNNIFVFAEDWAGNVSATTSIGVHRESTAPPQPTSVHVDNRSASARVSWDPVVNSGTSVPVAGYLVYYGPVMSSSYSQYTGDFVSQGPSPIKVPGQASAEITLTGLPNASPFFVAVAAYDGVVDPAPNVSPDLSTPPGFKVNPNLAPLDRAAHLDPSGYQFATPSLFNTAAALRDMVFVSQGTRVVTSNCFVTPTNVPPFHVRVYSYDKYGLQGLVEQPNSGTLSSLRARTLVADENRFVFGYDTFMASTITQQPGVDVIDAANPSSLSLVAGSPFLPTFLIDHLLPLHRPDAGGALKTHGVVTYREAGVSKLATFNYSGHSGAIGGCDLNGAGACNGINLSSSSIPKDVQVAGQFVFSLHGATLDSYTISNDFRTITAGASTGFVNTNNTQAMVVDWPRIYFNGDINGGAVLYEVQITGTAPLTFSSPVQIASLHNPATHMLVVGDELIVAEQMNQADEAIEAFSLANPDLPTLLGFYATDQIAGVEFGNTAQINSMQLSGNNLFVVETSTLPFCGGPGVVDVVELGTLRSSVRLGTAHPDGFVASAVRIKGSRAIATVGQYLTPVELASVDMHVDFTGAASFTKSARFTVPNICYTEENPFNKFTTNYCLPMTTAGDYAYVFQGVGAQGCTVSGCNQIAIYDVSTPDKLSGAPPLSTINVDITRGTPPVTTSTPVYAIAVANDYLFAALNSATDAVARWDISNPAAPIGPQLIASPTHAHGRTIDVYGKYAYVGHQTGFCVIDAFATPPVEVACVTTIPGATCGNVISSLYADWVHADSNRLYVAANDSFQCNDGVVIYDITNPAGPVVIPTNPGQALARYNNNTFAPMGMLLRSGPSLFSQQGHISSFGGILGYDLSFNPPALTGSALFTPFSMPQFAVAGHMLLAPDQSAGLVLLRLY
jgi:hypothetical protein